VHVVVHLALSDQGIDPEPNGWTRKYVLHTRERLLYTVYGVKLPMLNCNLWATTLRSHQ